MGRRYERRREDGASGADRRHCVEQVAGCCSTSGAASPLTSSFPVSNSFLNNKNTTTHLYTYAQAVTTQNLSQVRKPVGTPQGMTEPLSVVRGL